ncbi:MAG: FecR domain-containing protein, partial [Myxococcales bacterium]|nr:FecR domain-containing protein [Myxococcales bacterium]
MRNGANQIRRIFLCTAIFGALAFQAGSAAAAKNALLTSVKGEASIPSGALSSHTELGDDERLETGDESGCSILLDQNAVVELCGRTRIWFATNEKRGNRIVNVESGTLRLIVEPRELGERIEIHTPAAIATILGTIIYVTVDPVTGEATFTSSDSQINVRVRDDKDCTPIGLPAEAGIPRCAEGTTIGSLEQLTVMPGEKPREKKQVSEADLASLGGCLFDFHDLAAEIDRMTQANKATQRVVAMDVAAVDLPPVALDAGPAIETESG